MFSNNFDLDVISNTGSALFRYESTKLKLTAGSGISKIQLQLHDRDNNSKNIYNFLNYTPVTSITLTPKNSTYLNFQYNGKTTQPGINQLQPLRNNNDPLNVFVGNPDLKVGFRHNFQTFFRSYKVLKSRSMFFLFNYNITTNAIVFSNLVNDKGIRTYTPGF